MKKQVKRNFTGWFIAVYFGVFNNLVWLNKNIIYRKRMLRENVWKLKFYLANLTNVIMIVNAKNIDLRFAAIIRLFSGVFTAALFFN